MKCKPSNGLIVANQPRLEQLWGVVAPSWRGINQNQRPTSGNRKTDSPPFRDELEGTIIRDNALQQHRGTEKAKAALRNRPHRTGLPTGNLTLRMRNPMEAKVR